MCAVNGGALSHANSGASQKGQRAQKRVQDADPGPLRCRAMEVVNTEAAADAAAEKAAQTAMRVQQEDAAVVASRVRHTRALRVRRLKVGVCPLSFCET